mgnify:FL=1
MKEEQEVKAYNKYDIEKLEKYFKLGSSLIYDMERCKDKGAMDILMDELRSLITEKIPLCSLFKTSYFDPNANIVYGIKG